MVVLSGPSSQIITVNYATIAGGTATAGSDYNATSGILTFNPGQTSQTFNVPILNDATANEANETVLLELSNPTNALLGLSNATLTIVDDDVSPTVQFSGGAYSVNEADDNAVITVNLSTTSAQPVTVIYTTSDGTATAGSDYNGVSNPLIFAPGQTSQTFNVPILDDAFDETDETVLLTLSAPTNAALGAPISAVLTINDDDDPPTVQFSALTYSVNEANITIPLTVTLSAASALTVTVDYATSDRTATAGSDYLIATGTLTFAPGITSQTFSVAINDDTLDEPEETVRLSLSNENGATLGTPDTATLTIIDYDTAPGQCAGIYSTGEPNTGPPDGISIRIACETTIKVDLGTSITVLGDNNPDFDLVYYEIQGVSTPPPNPAEQIYMDWVIIEIAQSPSGPWYEVFNWGDGGPDTNTNIGTAPPPGPYSGPENDNTLIPMTTPPLYGTPPLITGIAIDVDAPLTAANAPLGPYQYVQIFSPIGGDSDGPEVDAIEAIP